MNSTRQRIIVLCSIVVLLVPLSALAQVDFCEGNFDYDADVDSSDAATFKTDFGRSSMKNPCPGGFAPVPKTGQTTSYDPGGGDDGALEKGVPLPNPRFTDNGNGTVTDNLTGLIWLKNAQCFGARTWGQALSDANGLSNGFCGLTDGSVVGDWRLPNLNELISLIDREECISPLPYGHPFTNVQPLFFWSSTTHACTNEAWYVAFIDGGGVDFASKIYDQFFVWPVRGGH